MRFMILIHDRQDSEVAGDGVDAANLAFDRRLRESGRFIAGGPLDRAETATVIRRNGDTTSMVDGPYVETKEHLAGFYLIEAASQQEAVEIAMPFLEVNYDSVIEVRQHWWLEDWLEGEVNREPVEFR